MTKDYYTQSRSIYRGQHDEGIGSGNGHPLTRGGDQYLNGTDEDLQEYEFLDPITAWLTLDAKVGDYQTLSNLEAWNYFDYEFSGKQYAVIARMVSAGDYRGRAAYFTHARIFEKNGQNDAAILIGCSECFDSPNNKTTISLSEESTIEKWHGLLKTPETLKKAKNFLEHLYLSIRDGYPLIIATPLSSFAENSELFFLIAFARYTLPFSYKEKCNIRLFTRLSLSGFDSIKPQLIALPNDNVKEALQQFPTAALLNEQGETLSDGTGRPQGWEIKDSSVRNYAKAILGNFSNSPQGLLAFNIFSKRFSNQIPINLIIPSYIFAENPNDLFELMLKNTKFEWHKLPINNNDWQRFPTDKLCELALKPDSDIEENTKALRDLLVSAWQASGKKFDDGFNVWHEKLAPPLSNQSNVEKLERLRGLWHQGLFSDETVKSLFCDYVLIPFSESSELQANIKQTLSDRHITLDNQLELWWENGLDIEKQKRLLDILNTTPNLFADKTKLADLCQKVPLSNWLGLSMPLNGLFATGILNKIEPTQLASLSSKYYNYLIKSALENCITTDWIQEINDADLIIKILKHSINYYHQYTGTIKKENYKITFYSLCYRLNNIYILSGKPEIIKLNIANSPEISQEIIGLNPSLFEIESSQYFKLANLLPEKNKKNELIISSLNTLVLSKNKNSTLSLTFSEKYPCINAAFWVDELLDEISQEYAIEFLTAKEFIESTDIDNLLYLLPIAGSDLEDEQAILVYQQVTRCWRKDPTNTTGKLLSNKAMAWFYWYKTQNQHLTKEEKRQAAVNWLNCSLWKTQQEKSDLASWNLVIANLMQLTGKEIKSICEDSFPLGLFIDWFEEKQLKDLLYLIENSENFDAFFELNSAIRNIRYNKKYYEDIFDYLLSNEQKHFNYLLIGNSTELDKLKFSDIVLLFDKAGQHTGKVQAVLIDRVFKGLTIDNLGERFDTLTNKRLWNNQYVMNVLADCVVKPENFALLQTINDKLPEKILIHPESKEAYKERAKQLKDNFNKLALFLDRNVNKTISNIRTEGQQEHETEEYKIFKEKLISFCLDNNIDNKSKELLDGLLNMNVAHANILNSYNAIVYENLANFILDKIQSFNDNISDKERQVSKSFFEKINLNNKFLEKIKQDNDFLYEFIDNRLPIFELYSAIKCTFYFNFNEGGFSKYVIYFVEKSPKNKLHNKEFTDAMINSFLKLIDLQNKRLILSSIECCINTNKKSKEITLFLKKFISVVHPKIRESEKLT